ncbi:hypothetical protein O181_083216 [Austropuccinia psidii MF-1]|uniref:Uncharacterized protein n=1 Tax=Austropuccinia psidii MF-1 TaxID=1389203 RepID=A0A9Q3FU52_9BASI|nr:hypothetical protein [Austropuccinia psidii MF-1]
MRGYDSFDSPGELEAFEEDVFEFESQPITRKDDFAYTLSDLILWYEHNGTEKNHLCHFLQHLPLAILNSQAYHQLWIQPIPRKDHGFGFFSDVDEQYIQCQFVNQLGKTCNKRLKKDQTGSTKGMSQHLHLLDCIANPKSLSSPLAKYNTMYQYDHNLNPKELCKPAYSNILVHQASLTAHLTKIYFYHKEFIFNYLLRNRPEVSFTTDSCTSPEITAYLAITSHYIDTDFKLTSIIIGLYKIEGNNAGASLATQLLTIIHHYNLEQKIIFITTDNASVNNKMAQEIEATFPKFCAKDHMVGCMAHTIHLAAHGGLKALGSEPPNTNNQLDNNNDNPM